MERVEFGVEEKEGVCVSLNKEEGEETWEFRFVSVSSLSPIGLTKSL